jgi:hypothetical protein
MCDDGVGGQLGAVRGHDGGGDDLATYGMGQADYEAVQHAGHGIQDRLDLGG